MKSKFKNAKARITCIKVDGNDTLIATMELKICKNPTAIFPVEIKVFASFFRFFTGAARLSMREVRAGTFAHSLLFMKEEEVLNCESFVVANCCS